MIPVGRDSNCHGHTNHGLGRSTDDGATRDGYKLGTISNKARNLGSWEGRHKRMKIEMMIKETRWNETRILD
mgnify:CR=1 FL=1